MKEGDDNSTIPIGGFCFKEALVCNNTIDGFWDSYPACQSKLYYTSTGTAFFKPCMTVLGINPFYGNNSEVVESLSRWQGTIQNPVLEQKAARWEERGC